MDSTALQEWLKEAAEATVFDWLAKLPCRQCQGTGWLHDPGDGRTETECSCSGTGFYLPGLRDRCLWGDVDPTVKHEEACQCGGSGTIPAPHDRLERLLAAMEAAGFEGMWVGGSWAFWRIGSSPDVEPHLDPSPYRAALLALEAEREAK
ncbi:hypothetical protein LCGC14_1773840 [marine sediment metagenome]|uniref:Uncharacterized protein n=1 Tax=marine sediment metagenome TaxID=412755 RepID=A0A0F9GXK1_9ZZZZ